jgi:isoamylase
MLFAGDEIGRSQKGNNNAYCQDNETSWLNWSSADSELLAFTASLMRMRRDHPSFRRRHFFLDKPIHGEEVREIGWYRADGTPRESKAGYRSV